MKSLESFLNLPDVIPLSYWIVIALTVVLISVIILFTKKIKRMKSNNQNQTIHTNKQNKLTLLISAILFNSKILFIALLFIIAISVSIITNLVFDISGLTTFVYSLFLGIIYALGLMVKDTVKSPDLFAKMTLGDFQREGDTIFHYIFPNLDREETIPLFRGGKSFFLWWETFIKVPMKPVSFDIDIKDIDCNKIAYQAKLKCTAFISTNYFHRFIKVCGNIDKEIGDVNFNLAKSEYEKTAGQLLRNTIEGDNSYANSKPDEIQKLSGKFLSSFEKKLKELEDDRNSQTHSKADVGFITLEKIGMDVGRFSLDISAQDPAIRLAGELPYKAEMEAQASEKNKSTLKNIGKGLADAVEPIIKVLNGGDAKNSAQVANSAVTLLRTGLPGSKIDQSIIDLNDSSGKAGINVRGGSKK